MDAVWGSVGGADGREGAVKQDTVLLRWAHPVLADSAEATRRRSVKDEAREEVVPEGALAAAPRVEVVLDGLFPPREWEDSEDRQWVQFVSAEPATGAESHELEVQLDRMLRERHALPDGMCPVREALFDQCFDELIRQVSCDCVERGLILARIRDEGRLAVSTYEALYEAVVQMAARKRVAAEAPMRDEEHLAALEAECTVLEATVADLKAKHDTIEKREGERRATEERKHVEETTYLRKSNQQLAQEIRRHQS